jgi:hypothetical protein
MRLCNSIDVNERKKYYGSGFFLLLVSLGLLSLPICLSVSSMKDFFGFCWALSLGLGMGIGAMNIIQLATLDMLHGEDTGGNMD